PAGNRTGDSSSSGGRTWTYDARNEPLTATGGLTYAYSARGTLASTTTGGSTASTAFDALGHMVSDAGQSYTYDGLDRLAGRGSATFSYDGTESAPVITPGETYARGAGGEILAGHVGNTIATPATDTHGDITSWQALDGTSAGTAGYTPYGQPAHANGLIA